MTAPYSLAVFGDPIAHSRSPEIHRAFGRQAQLNVEYRKIRTNPELFPTRLTEFQIGGGFGANVTVPLKERAAGLCASMTGRAEQAGAVNTLIWQGQGWHGDNTDGAGLVLDLRRLGIRLTGARVLLVGAGGAARGVLDPLITAGVRQIHIVNRTAARAVALAGNSSGGTTGGDFASAGQEPVDLVIQATSAGLQQTAPPLPEALWQQQPFCYDMQYGTELSPFLQKARSLGCAYADGLGMLVGQAAVSFHLWTGFQPHLLPVLQSLRQP